MSSHTREVGFRGGVEKGNRRRKFLLPCEPELGRLG